MATTAGVRTADIEEQAGSMKEGKEREREREGGRKGEGLFSVSTAVWKSFPLKEGPQPAARGGRPPKMSFGSS